MIVVRLLIDVFIVIGAVFALAGTLGLLKMHPDARNGLCGDCGHPVCGGFPAQRRKCH